MKASINNEINFIFNFFVRLNQYSKLVKLMYR